MAQAGGRAVGISGKDGGLITARKLMATAKTEGSAIEEAIDLVDQELPAIIAGLSEEIRVEPREPTARVALEGVEVGRGACVGSDGGMVFYECGWRV